MLAKTIPRTASEAPVQTKVLVYPASYVGPLKSEKKKKNGHLKGFLFMNGRDRFVHEESQLRSRSDI